MATRYSLATTNRRGTHARAGMAGMAPAGTQTLVGAQWVPQQLVQALRRS